MDIKERFNTFDQYIESIPELESAATQIKKIARYVFEATTGTPAPSVNSSDANQLDFEWEHEPVDPNNVADYLNLEDFCEKVSRNLQNTHMLPRSATKRIQNLLTDIQVLSNSPDIANLDATQALRLVNMLPDLSNHIESLENQLAKIRTEFMPLIGRTTDLTKQAKARELKQQYQTVDKNLQILKAYSDPIESLKTAVTGLATAINQAKQADQKNTFLNRQFARDVAKRDMQSYHTEKNGLKAELINTFLGMKYDESNADSYATNADALAQASRLRSFGDTQSADEITAKAKQNLADYITHQIEQCENDANNTESELVKASLQSKIGLLHYSLRTMNKMIDEAANTTIDTKKLNKANLSAVNTLNNADSGIMSTLNDVVQIIRRDSNDIGELMAAFNAQRTNMRAGKFHPLEDYLTAGSYNHSEFVENEDGTFQYVVQLHDNTKVKIPLFLAHEITKNFFDIYHDGNGNVVFEENYPSTDANKQPVGLHRWNVVYVPDNMFSIVNIVASFSQSNSAGRNEVDTVDVFSQPMSAIIVKTFTLLSHLVPGMKPPHPKLKHRLQKKQ